jgi:hypothetical protein
MTKEVTITIGDEMYVFGPTEAGADVCNECALHELCGRIDGTTLCEILGIELFNNYNFRREKAEKGPIAATENDEGNEHGGKIDEDTFKALKRLGILDTSVRSYNRGASDYSRHIIQPWSIWQDYQLNAWDADIVKRVLRKKDGDSRRLDYEKIIHICEERIRQIDAEQE